jgi:hypothetical protein
MFLDLPLVSIVTPAHKVGSFVSETRNHLHPGRYLAESAWAPFQGVGRACARVLSKACEPLSIPQEPIAFEAVRDR